MDSKKEFIQLHKLFAEVVKNYESQTDKDIDLEPYRELGVGPSSAHRSKGEHKKALETLASCVEDQMREELKDENGEFEELKDITEETKRKLE